MKKITRLKIKQKSSAGFTIVELMIALSVLSLILLISSMVLIKIGSLYTKGVNAATLQNTARTIQDDVTASIKFNGSSPNIPPAASLGHDSYKAYCIGNTRYTFITGSELGHDQAKPSGSQDTAHVLWRDTLNSPTSCAPYDFNKSDTQNNSKSDGYEMAAQHTRLTKFSIAQLPGSSSAYVVDVWMAYGDSDLVQLGGGGHYICKGGTGTQFCSISELSSTIIKRLN